MLPSLKDRRHLRVSDLWKVIIGLALSAGSIDMLHIYLSYRFGIEELNWSRTAVVFIVWWLTYTLVLVAALFLARRYPLVPLFRARTFLLHFLAAAGLAYVHTVCNALAYPPPLYPGVTALRLSVYLARMNFPIDFVSYWTIVGVTYAFHFYSSVQETRVAEANLAAKAQQLQASLVESRLHALRSQLNPHFLFNTLNVISTLMLKGDLVLANRVILRLSAILRVCLNDKRPQLITLANELGFLNDYLEIQQLMLGERLTVRREINPDTLDAYVPCMLLQPIVENSVVHGVASQETAGEVVIEAFYDGEMLELVVSDSGPGFQHNMDNARGVGLSNTRARLQQIYGNLYDLAIGQCDRGGALVRIRIPLRTSEEVPRAETADIGVPAA